jgi:hypothetical protein
MSIREMGSMRYLIMQSAGHNAGPMNFSKIEAIVAHIYGEVFTAMADAITASGMMLKRETRRQLAGLIR